MNNLKKPVKIKSPSGKLGVLLPGMGAVATTFIAGGLGIKRGLGLPIGSLTQMATIRIGKRSLSNFPNNFRLRTVSKIRSVGIWRLGYL